MGVKKKAETELKTSLLRIFLTAGERQAVKSAAQAEHMDMSGFRLFATFLIGQAFEDGSSAFQ